MYFQSFSLTKRLPKGVLKTLTYFCNNWWGINDVLMLRVTTAITGHLSDPCPPSCLHRPASNPPCASRPGCGDVLMSCHHSAINKSSFLVLRDPSLKPPQCISESDDCLMQGGGLWLVTRSQYWPLIGQEMEAVIDNWPETTAITQHHSNYPLATTTIYVHKLGCPFP